MTSIYANFTIIVEDNKRIIAAMLNCGYASFNVCVVITQYTDTF